MIRVILHCYPEENTPSKNTMSYLMKYEFLIKENKNKWGNDANYLRLSFT